MSDDATECIGNCTRFGDGDDGDDDDDGDDWDDDDDDDGDDSDGGMQSLRLR